MKELTIEQAVIPTVDTQANGTAPLDDALPLTPDQRLAAFQADLTALMERYGVRFAPYVKTYNDGSQAAAIDFVTAVK